MFSNSQGFSTASNIFWALNVSMEAWWVWCVSNVSMCDHTQENFRIPSPERLCQQFKERCFPPCSNQSALPPLIEKTCKPSKECLKQRGWGLPNYPQLSLELEPNCPRKHTCSVCWATVCGVRGTFCLPMFPGQIFFNISTGGRVWNLTN